MPRPIALLVLAGLTGGTIGFFGGLQLGSALGGGNRICGDDAGGLEKAACGAITGESTQLTWRAISPIDVSIAQQVSSNSIERATPE